MQKQRFFSFESQTIKVDEFMLYNMVNNKEIGKDKEKT